MGSVLALANPTLTARERVLLTKKLLPVPNDPLCRGKDFLYENSSYSIFRRDLKNRPDGNNLVSLLRRTCRCL